MCLEIQFPIEFTVEGTPISLQASPPSKNAWKKRVAEAAMASLEEGYFLTEAPVSLTIYYFPLGETALDTDNIIKPIQDALSKVIYKDDSQVEKVVSQFILPDFTYVLNNPTDILSDTFNEQKPIVYIRVDGDLGWRNLS